MTSADQTWPEPVVMSATDSAAFMAQTDEAACTCQHQGLPLAYHREFCDLMQANPLAIGTYCPTCDTRLDDKATGSSPSHACPICGDDK